MATTGNRDLVLLRELDGFDQQLARVEGDLRDLPEDLARAERERAAEEQALEALRHEQKQRTREIAKLEGEAEANKDQIGRYRGQQNQAKTNEEYSTLKRQITALEKKNSDLEDEALERYMRMDELKASEVEAKKALEKAEVRFARERGVIEADQRELVAKRDTLQAEREQRTAKVSAEILRLYGRILERSGGRALSRIQGRRCESCHLNVPSERVSLVHEGGQIVSCPSCSRILYLERL